MAARGRPTPHPDGEFQDRLPEEFTRPDLNPFMTLHREFGPPLFPADAARTWKGRWAELFGREAPLHLEIGSGNGFFLTGLAQQHPDWNVVGIEIRYKRTVLCARKIREAGITNAVIVRYHAAYLDDLFEPGTLHGIYVNHPDPWPKERHDKNRLISRWFLEDVCRLLVPGGVFRLKSDFAPNVERVEELLANGPDGEPLPRLPLEITGRSEDVAANGAPWPDDIMTNYQRKMLVRGIPVHALEAVRTPASWPG